jgi:hypothetical protein
MLMVLWNYSLSLPNLQSAPLFSSNPVIMLKSPASIQPLISNVVGDPFQMMEEGFLVSLGCEAIYI